jgi:hypothetical protein
MDTPVNFHIVVRHVLTRFCERGRDVEVRFNTLGDGVGHWDRAHIESDLDEALALAFDLANGGHHRTAPRNYRGRNSRL